MFIECPRFRMTTIMTLYSYFWFYKELQKFVFVFSCFYKIAGTIDLLRYSASTNSSQSTLYLFNFFYFNFVIYKSKTKKQQNNLHTLNLIAWLVEVYRDNTDSIFFDHCLPKKEIINWKKIQELKTDIHEFQYKYHWIPILSITILPKKFICNSIGFCNDETYSINHQTLRVMVAVQWRQYLNNEFLECHDTVQSNDFDKANVHDNCFPNTNVAQTKT